MREDLGDCYTETLRATYPEMPESADFVMFWWHKAAALVRSGAVRRFGFITTNSIRQTFNRRIVAAHLRPEKGDKLPPLALRFAIPDHPWVDTADGAAVRIAMTVGELAGDDPTGVLLTVTAERPNSERLRELRAKRSVSDDTLEEETADYDVDDRKDDGSLDVDLEKDAGHVSPDFTVGADVTATRALKANDGLTYRGMQLIVSPAEAKALGFGKIAGLEKHIRPYRNGRDLTDQPRDVLVIDFFGLDVDAVQTHFPSVYEHLIRTVKPERDSNAREGYRKNWWIHGEPRRDLRTALAGLPRYIATVETAKHRFFQFLEAEILPDNRLVLICSHDAFHLGVLGSRFHVTYAVAAGGTLEDRPVYNKTTCFDSFPFPVCDDKQRAYIAKLAETLDAHRKRAQAEHGLGLTTIYNVLEKLRTNQPLTAKETLVHDQALVSTLRLLHDDLDAAVAAAYGWPADLTDDEILENLVALNATRAKEEKLGKVRWLRPEFQAPAQDSLSLASAKKSKKTKVEAAPKRSRVKTPWPKERPAQVEAVSAALNSFGREATAAELATGFARAKKEAISEILAALVIIGRAHCGEKRGTFTA